MFAPGDGFAGVERVDVAAVHVSAQSRHYDSGREVCVHKHVGVGVRPRGHRSVATAARLFEEPPVQALGLRRGSLAHGEVEDGHGLARSW